MPLWTGGPDSTAHPPNMPHVPGTPTEGLAVGDLPTGQAIWQSRRAGKSDAIYLTYQIGIVKV